MAKPLEGFRDLAILTLANALAETDSEQVSVKSVGALLRKISGWEVKAMLLILASMDTASPPYAIPDDDEELFACVPPRAFEGPHKLHAWMLRVKQVQEALALVRQWGFCSSGKPTNGALFNALMVRGLQVFARNVDGVIRRDELYRLLQCLGLSREEADVCVAAARKYPITGAPVQPVPEEPHG